MLSSLVALALTPVAYGFTGTAPLNFEVKVGFDGFIPVFGGQVGTVDVTLAMQVVPTKPEKPENLATVGELKDIKVVFNGADLPLSVANASNFFPKNRIEMTPQGKIVKNDAPSVSLPVRLPGLDVKRIPDITYVPIEFPAEGVEEGKAFQYVKAFGDSNVTYTVTPVKIEGDTITLDLQLAQDYTVMEDTSVQVVSNPADAAYQVETAVRGKGSATFDRKRNLVTKMRIDATAESRVTELANKNVSTRTLRTSLEVTVKDERKSG